MRCKSTIQVGKVELFPFSPFPPLSARTTKTVSRRCQVSHRGLITLRGEPLGPEQLGRRLLSILVFMAATLLPLSLTVPACHCLKDCTSTSPFLSHENLFQGSKLQCLSPRLFRYTGNDPSYCYRKPQVCYVHRAESFLGDTVLHCLGIQLFLHSDLFYLLHFYSSSHLRKSCSMLLWN